jgi:hypothetical protein
VFDYGSFVISRLRVVSYSTGIVLDRDMKYALVLLISLKLFLQMLASRRLGWEVDKEFK